MKSITIEELLEDNDFYIHVTHKKNLSQISQYGLKADIGANSRQGSETRPKVFFARGIAGEVGILNRYLNLLSEKYQDKTIMYTHFKDILENMAFLKLDLTHTDKANYENMSKEEKENIDYLEDDINEENGKMMTSRNSHLIAGKGVNISKISYIEGSTIELVKKLLEKYKELYPKQDYLKNSIDKDYLSGFIKFVSRGINLNEHDKISRFHDQKSDQYFEDIKTGKYFISKEQIEKATINASTQAKQEAAKVEAENIRTEDKVNEGESLDGN